ncbi:MltR family transcriptional regulator [Neobacillus sp. WH10]|uniref:MltR family transcriptional regulator n=1 Tax=Neobacillus sp. WH10 TaxID=3047873 RepID=UPI0024C17FEA|nr:MltR family transcriptional regulator [Neobacillus sp. WH10]WHY75718.1 MltR family transcriptional regulator [Neobacillus sp. WH10]
MEENIFEKYTKNSKYRAYRKEFEKEISNNSDRGIVLICGSIIDSMLSELLKAFLIKSDRIDKEVLNNNGILGTFDSKIKIAYYLGLLSIEERRNLELLQKVRNKFAHIALNISFEDNDVSNICSNFRIPKNGFLPQDMHFQEPSDDLPKVDLNPLKKNTPTKEKFIIVFRYLFTILGDRIAVNKIEKRKEFNVTITADVLIENQINAYNRLLLRNEEVIKTIEKELNDSLKQIDKLEILKTSFIEKEAMSEIENTEKLLKKAQKTKEAYNEILEGAIKDNELLKQFAIHYLPKQEYSLKVIQNSMK